MSKIRVYELARELKIESKALVTKLKALGVDVASHQSTLSGDQVLKVRKALGKAGEQEEPKAAAPRVIRRRRKVAEEEGGGVSSASGSKASDTSVGVIESSLGRSGNQSDTGESSDNLVQSGDFDETASAESTSLSLGKEEKHPVSDEGESQRTQPKVRLASSISELTQLKGEGMGLTNEHLKPKTSAEEDTFSKAPVTFKKSSSGSPLESNSETVAPEVIARKEDTTDSQQADSSGSVSAAKLEDPPSQFETLDKSNMPQEETIKTVAKENQKAKNAPASIDHSEPIGNSARILRKAPKVPDDQRGTRPTDRRTSSSMRASDDRRPRRPSVSEGSMSASRSSAGPSEAPRGGLADSQPASVGDAGWKDSGKLIRDRKKPHGTPVVGASGGEDDVLKRAVAKPKRTAFKTRDLLDFMEETDDGENVNNIPVAKQRKKTVYTPAVSGRKKDLKRRKDLKKTQITTPRAAYRVIKMGQDITVGQLSKSLSVKSGELIKKLMGHGVMATINQPLDFDTASLIAGEYNFEVQSSLVSLEEVINQARKDGSKQELSERPPIVTIMGHVDHGKTSILDAIRASNVASGEAGGITQHIGAYTVEKGGKRISFLDTPGHEAFSSMRSRGAKVTDIVVLVVAADDGVMPQTVEAISHAKSADVPIVVAVNKVDKPNVNFDRIYTELMEHGIQAEEWGGDVQFVKVSALKRTGIDGLLDAINLQAEILELKADPSGYADGVVIEANLDRGRGPIATIMVQSGTLNVGDFLVAGVATGKVRAMHDHTGATLLEAGPSTPVQVLGLSNVPMSGDQVTVVEDDRSAKDIVTWREQRARERGSGRSSAATLEQLLERAAEKEILELPLIIKADTQGSVEAVSEAVQKIESSKIRNKTIHKAVGGISESDLSLAETAGAIVIGFNVRAGRNLDDLAEKNGVVIKYYSVIYDVVDALKSIMAGRLPPVLTEVIQGKAEVRQTIKVPKIGTVAGAAVMEGKVTRSSLLRLVREQVVVYTGKVASLRRFKDDVKEVVQGYECGISIDGYNDIREGDVIEAYTMEESLATL